MKQAQLQSKYINRKIHDGKRTLMILTVNNRGPHRGVEFLGYAVSSKRPYIVRFAHDNLPEVITSKRK